MGIESKIPMASLLALRKMPREKGERWIAQQDGLSPTEIEQLQRLLPAEVVDKYTLNRVWITVAYLLGATNSQIALDEGISRQAISDKITRFMRARPSSLTRVASAISLEMYSEAKEIFFSNYEEYLGLPPFETARRILYKLAIVQASSVESRGTEGRGGFLDPDASSYEE